MQEQQQGTPLTTLNLGSGDGGGKRAPLGEYEATLIEVADMGLGQYADERGHTPNRLRFSFRIDKVLSIDTWPEDLDTKEKKREFRDGLIGFTYYAFCNYSPGPRSDMTKWVTWMLGEPMAGQLDVGRILDVRYRLTIGTVPKQSPDGRTINKVEPTGIRRLADEDDDELF